MYGHVHCSTMAKPLVVAVTEMPESITRAAHDAGKIDLRVWRPSASESHVVATNEWLRENAPGASALLIVVPTPATDDLMQAAGPSLKVVSTMSVGADHIDTAAAKRRGIRVGYTPAVLSDAVADMSLLLALMVMRNVPEAMRVVTTGAWPMVPWSPLSFTGPSLAGKTVGFIGFGDIAQTLAAKLAAFSPARIVYKASKPRPFCFGNASFRRLSESPLLAAHYQVHQRLPVDIVNEDDPHALAAQCDVVLYVDGRAATYAA